MVKVKTINSVVKIEDDGSELVLKTQGELNLKGNKRSISYIVNKLLNEYAQLLKK